MQKHSNKLQSLQMDSCGLLLLGNSPNGSLHHRELFRIVPDSGGEV